MQGLAKLCILAAVALIGNAWAIQPPVVTQPIVGVLQITIKEPTAWNDDAAKGFTGRAYRLYFTQEAAAISVSAATGETKYTYIVPVGYTTKATDSVAATAVGNDGEESNPSASIPLPVGVNTPGPKPGAPGGISVVRAPN